MKLYKDQPGKRWKGESFFGQKIQFYYTAHNLQSVRKKSRDINWFKNLFVFCLLSNQLKVLSQFMSLNF